jgi:hypothetical protein
VAGRCKRRRDGYTNRVPARGPGGTRGASHQAGQTHPQSACRGGNAARDDVCVVGPTPQDGAHDFVEFAADREARRGAGGGIALEHSSTGVVPGREEALRAEAIEEPVGAVERVLNGVAGALEETVLMLAQLLLRRGNGASVEVECIEKTGVRAARVVWRIHQRRDEGWQMQVQTESRKVWHDQIKPINERREEGRVSPYPICNVHVSEILIEDPWRAVGKRG